MNQKRKGPAVLVVEDETDLRENFVELLADEGYRPVPAATLREALVKLRNQQFDLVLLDLRLGEDSGTEVLQYLRTKDAEDKRRTFVIVTSGNLDMNVVQELRGQVQDCLVKPFGGAELLERVGRLCPASSAGTSEKSGNALG